EARASAERIAQEALDERAARGRDLYAAREAADAAEARARQVADDRDRLAAALEDAAGGEAGAAAAAVSDSQNPAHIAALARERGRARPREAGRRGGSLRRRTPLQLIGGWILVVLVVVLLLAIVTGLLRIDLIP